jgi:hypothetical protein
MSRIVGGAGLRSLFILFVALSLSACASDVIRSADSGLAKPQFAVGQGKQAGNIAVALTEDAQKQAADNLKFNHETLLATVRRALEGNKVLAKDGDPALPRVDILVTDVRVRSNFSAIMFGFMAGDDRIKGDVIVRAPNGTALQQFTISTSYALGGIAGGQDSARMDWLYEAFAKRVLEELTGQPKP